MLRVLVVYSLCQLIFPPCRQQADGEDYNQPFQVWAQQQCAAVDLLDTAGNRQLSNKRSKKIDHTSLFSGWVWVQLEHRAMKLLPVNDEFCEDKINSFLKVELWLINFRFLILFGIEISASLKNGSLMGVSGSLFKFIVAQEIDPTVALLHLTTSFLIQWKFQHNST